MKKFLQAILKYGVPVVIGVFLIWFLLTRVNIAEMKNVMASANFWWFGIVIVVSGFSHVFRAMRWRLQLRALGIDAPLGPDACHLSGGQRCRLLTALALAGDEPVLLLDEPTAGLDAATAARLLDALFAHAKATGRTLLVITHARAILPRFAQVLSLSP